MKYALVILEPLVPFDEQGQLLRNFANTFQGLEQQNPIAVRLNTGAYVIPLENGLLSLAKLTDEAASRGIGVRTIFFENEIPWARFTPR